MKRKKMRGGREKQRERDARKAEARVIDVDSAEVPNQLNNTSEQANSTPLLRCQVEVHANKLEITPTPLALQGADASEELEVSATKWFGQLRASLVTKDTRQVVLKLRAPQNEPARSGRSKWWARSRAAFCWLLFGSYLVSELGFVGGLLQRFSIDSEWEPWILIGLAAAIFIYLASLGTRRAITSSLYLIFFPFTALGLLVSKGIGGWRVLSATARALDSLLLKGANWLLLILACSIVVKTNREIPICVALIYMAFGAAYLIVSNFLWVTRPVPYVFRFLDWVEERLRSSLLSFSAKFTSSFLVYRQALSGHREKSSEQERKVSELLTHANSYVIGAKFVKNHLRTIVSPAVLFYLFTVRFLITVALLLMLFAAGYLAASKLSPGAFGGARGIPGFAEALYFSITNFFTVNFGDIVPVSTLARALITLQVITGLTMLTLLLLSFSTLSMQVATTTTERFELKADAIIGEIAGIIGQHYEVQKDVENALAQIRANPSLRWLHK